MRQPSWSATSSGSTEPWPTLGPTDAATLAAETRCDTRLVQEWLDAQFVSGYCHFSAQTSMYWLSPEQAAVLADPSSPTLLIGSMTIAALTAND